MANAAFSIEIDGLKDLQKNMSAVSGEMKSLLVAAMVSSTTRIKNEAQNNLTKNGTNFQGSLLRSITVVEVSELRGVVGVGEGKYGPSIEFGRKPGKMPPVAPLERWASLKLGKPGIGFLIARKIARQGTKAQPFMGPAFNENRDFVVQQFEDVARRIVIELGR